MTRPETPRPTRLGGTMTTLRWVKVPGLANARDVAGPAALPRLRPGRLLRAACPNEVTAEGARRLARDYRVVRVVDLRSGSERALAPDGPLTGTPGVTTLHCPLTPAAFDLGGGLPWELQPRLTRAERRTGLGYLRFLTDRPDSVVAALRAVAAPGGATLVHCSAGKDRTGVIVALALAAVGVPERAILADFLASNECLDALLAQQRRTGYGHLYAGRAPSGYRVRAEALSGLLARLAGAPGGLSGWLRSAGWTGRDQARLTAALVAPEGRACP